MLSACFHVGILEIFVSSLFLLVVLTFVNDDIKYFVTQKEDSQEEDHKLISIIIIQF